MSDLDQLTFDIMQQAAQSGITVTHGHIGNPDEFYEFNAHCDNQRVYIAQKCPFDYWIVYRVTAGELNKVAIIGSYYPHQELEAVDRAFSACLSNE